MIAMTKLSFSGIKLSVDIQNDWVEITHTEEVSQVMNKTTCEYTLVNRSTLKFDDIS